MKTVTAFKICIIYIALEIALEKDALENDTTHEHSLFTNECLTTYECACYVLNISIVILYNGAVLITLYKPKKK